MIKNRIIKHKKAKSFDLAFILFNLKVTTTKAKHYFLCFLLKYLSTTEIEKLTTAPIVANATVFNISSEFKLGTILKNVPPAVPTKVGLIGWCITFFSQLTNS